MEVRVLIAPDEGQTDAINKGFLMATGDIVCWLNTDERYHDGALARVVAYFGKHQDVDFVFGNCDFVDADGRFIRGKREYFYSQSMLLYYGCFIPSCAAFISRRVIDDGVLLDKEFKVTMDFDWYVRLALNGYRFARLPVSLACFTWHENNISSNLVERRRYERRLVQERYSGISGPAWFRAMVFEIIRYVWIGVRVLRRALR